jgi:glycosyltransferase involved in cell wall biosynthesis
MAAPPDLSVVCPVYNEEDVLRELHQRLIAALARTGLTYELVFTNNASTDGSLAILRELAAGDPHVRVVSLSRNFGKQRSLTAGIDFATGRAVVLIDADLQDPPELILDMVGKWREGYDVVYGRRRTRRESFVKRAGYWAFYRLVAFLADISLPLDSGDFCLMDQQVVRVLRSLPEKIRFPRGLRAWVGFRQTGLDYDRPARLAGSSKYSFRRLYRLATDGVISSSVRPLQVAQVASVSYLVLIGVVALLIVLKPPALEVAPWVLVGYLLILSGNFVQALCIYILGAYVGRTYLEAKGRPSYVVMEVIGDDGAHPGKAAGG